MAASVHSWQLVHSATSMIRFHLDIATPVEPSFETHRCAMLLAMRTENIDRPHPEEAAKRPSRGWQRLIHHFAGTRLATSPMRSITFCFSISANTADTCSVRPSHGSTSTNALAPASEWVDLVWVRSGVSRLRQPPRSTDLPGSPIGSYTADDS